MLKLLYLLIRIHTTLLMRMPSCCEFGQPHVCTSTVRMSTCTTFAIAMFYLFQTHIPHCSCSFWQCLLVCYNTSSLVHYESRLVFTKAFIKASRLCADLAA